MEQSDARRDLTRAYVLLARARQVRGNVQGALEALEQALDVGIKTQTFHHLVVEGQHVFDLFRLLLQQNPADRRPAQIIAHPRLAGRRPRNDRRVEPGGVAPTLHLALLCPGAGPRGKGRPSRALEIRKARNMTFYLLTHPPRSRDQILAAFWPDARLEIARSAFHCTKYRARKVVGRQLIAFEDGLYKIVWDPDCWFDVQAFELLLDKRDGDRLAHLEQALSLYQGDFLQGYDAEWCLPIRERLRARYRDALLELSELYVERRKPADALAALKRAVAVDDFCETSVRALMRFHARDGRPRAATDVFQQLEQRLQNLHTRPERETQSLYRSIRAGGQHLRPALAGQIYAQQVT